MKQHNESLALLKELNSPYWNVRSAAIQKMKEIKSPDEVSLLFSKIEKEKDENLRFHFVVLMEELLKSNNEELNGVAIYGLTIWSDKGLSGISARANMILEEYFSAPDIYRYLKIKAIRYAWKRLPRSKRLKLVDVVGHFQFRELSSLLLSSFSIRNETLWIRTITILRRFRDSRGNRYIKRILNSGTESTELIRTSLSALGRLGSVFDYRIVDNFFHHKNFKVRVAAIHAYSHLLGVFALPRLYYLYLHTNSEKVKLEIISIFGRTDSYLGCRYLVRIFKEDNPADIQLHVGWALHDIENKIKVPLLMRKFYKGEEKFKVKILNFLSEVYDLRIIDLLSHILRNHYSDIVTNLAISLCSAYDHKKINPHLKRMALDFNTLKGYTALLVLSQKKNFDMNEVLKLFLVSETSLDGLAHHVILKALKDRELNKVEKEKGLAYLKKVLLSGKLDIINFAIEASTKLNDEHNFKILVGILNRQEMKMLEEVVIKAILEILYKKPSYIPLARHCFSNNYFIQDFDEYKFNWSFAKYILKDLDSDSEHHYEKFFKVNAKRMIKEIEKLFFLADDDLSMAHGIIRMAALCDYTISQSALKLIVKSYYEEAPLEIKAVIIELVTKYGSWSFTDFIFKESLELGDNFPVKVTTFMNNVERSKRE